MSASSRHHPCDVEDAHCVVDEPAITENRNITQPSEFIWTRKAKDRPQPRESKRPQIASRFVLEHTYIYTMPCLSIPGAKLARCGTLRPAPQPSSASSPNSANHSESGHRAVHGAPAASHSDTTSIPADRPALPTSISGGVPNSSANGSITSTRCASPMQAQEAHANNNQNRQAVTDILAMSPSRITRPQIQLVEASLPMFDNLVSPNLMSRNNNNLCPPMMHSWSVQVRRRGPRARSQRRAHVLAGAQDLRRVLPRPRWQSLDRWIPGQILHGEIGRHFQLS